MWAKRRFNTIVTTVLLVLSLIIMMVPFYMIVVNSFKPFSEIAANIFIFPKNFTTRNYFEAWRRLNFSTSLRNTAIISIFSNFGGIALSSMTGYWIIRHFNKYTKTILFVLIAFMSIPFQALMIPFTKITSSLGMTNTLWGVIVSFWALTVPLSTFMTTGAVKSVPVEIEESAVIDGCSSFRIFWSIVFPLIRANVFTVATINTMWFWNDYLMTQLMISKKALRTIQISMQALFNEAFFAWDVALAALTLAILPLFIFFIIAQKQVLEGMTSGAVKG